MRLLVLVSVVAMSFGFATPAPDFDEGRLSAGLDALSSPESLPGQMACSSGAFRPRAPRIHGLAEPGGFAPAAPAGAAT